MMKKTFVSLLALLTALALLLSLTACLDPQAPDEPSNPETPGEQPNDERPTDDPVDDPADDTSFDAQYWRSGYPESLGPLAVTVIRTRSELDFYLDAIPYPDASVDNAPTLIQLCERYDEEYFASRDLIIAFVREGSGSVRHKVNQVSRDDTTGQWTIDIESILPDGDCTADEAHWQILIEPPKNMRVQEGDVFKIGEYTHLPEPLYTFGQMPPTDEPVGDTSFDAQYLRWGYPESLGHLAVTVIRSRPELDVYLDTIPNPDAQTFGRYDEDYFASRDLIIVFLMEGSGSIRHKVNAVSRDDTTGQWTIGIERLIPEVGTDDEAYWQILIEPPKNMRVQEGDVFKINGRTRSPLPLSVFSDVPPADAPADDASFGAQCLPGGFRADFQDPSVTVIRTRFELDVYLDTFSSVTLQTFERYDEAYFAERDLIVVFLQEGSGSIRHKVNKVSRDDTTGQWTIDIERIIPDVCTEDMAGWKIFIEPPKNMRVQEGDVFHIDGCTVAPLPLSVFGYYRGGVQYVRTNGRAPDAEFPSSLIIRSKQELLDYYENNKAYYNMDSSWDESPAFRDAIKRYDDAYFAKHELLVVLMEEPSGDIRHKVNHMWDVIIEGERVYNISITSFTSMRGDSDMAQWHILIELPEWFHSEPGDEITLVFKER